MKKALLGTTALIAAGLAFGNAAYAADGVKLSIGGRYMGAAGVNFDDADGFDDDGRTRDYVFKQDVEVYFLGETVLDNGLTVGARVELEGQTSGDQIDAVYAYFSGGFGEIRFGDTGEAMTQLCYVAPTASGIFGADSPNFNFSNAGVAGVTAGIGNLGIGGYGATNGTCYGVDDKSTKLVYFSPNFAGFSFAASFTPDNTEDTRNTLGGAATRLKTDTNQNSQNLSVAGNFTHDFNNINLVVGGGATWSFDKENSLTSDERADYNAYAQVGFSGFTIGGAFGYRLNRGNDGSDDLVYSAGITYNWDAWTIGLGYSHGQYEIGQDGTQFVTGLGGGSTVTFTGDVVDYSNVYALTASYALGPGIQIDGVVEYDDYQAGTEQGRDSDYTGFSFGLGTLISF